MYLQTVIYFKNNTTNNRIAAVQLKVYRQSTKKQPCIAGIALSAQVR
jgi:hypothetical protein